MGAGLTFTIEVRYTKLGSAACDVIAQFTTECWNCLFYELGVSDAQALSWSNKVQAEGRHIPIFENFNELSKLAYIDEGVVHFEADELSTDCRRVWPRLRNFELKQMVGALLRAADMAATLIDAGVVVHPFPK